MRFIIEKDYESMSRVAKNILLGTMYKNRRVNVAFTGGSTPIKMFEFLVSDVKDKNYFNQVHYYTLEEVPYKGETGYGVFMSNLNQLFFEPANISKQQIHILDEHSYQDYDKNIKEAGGLDLIVLGIATDGHINGSRIGSIKLEDETVAVSVNINPTIRKGILNDVGNDESKLPDYFLTVGPKSIMKAKRIVLMVSGKGKANIIKQALFGLVTDQIPASIFQFHPNVTVVLDEEAASEIIDLI